jgi:hypothetical protein
LFLLEKLVITQQANKFLTLNGTEMFYHHVHKKLPDELYLLPVHWGGKHILGEPVQLLLEHRQGAASCSWGLPQPVWEGLVFQAVLFLWHPHVSPVVVVVLAPHYLTAAPSPGSAVLPGLSEVLLIVGQTPKSGTGNEGSILFSIYQFYTNI